MAEYGARDAGVVDLVRLVAEEGVGERLALANRDRGQLHPVSHVADGKDRGHAGAVVGVDLDLALVAKLQPGRVATDTLDIGTPPDREKNLVGLDVLAPRHPHTERSVVVLLDSVDLR